MTIKLYRISPSKFINDISGIGAKLYGGRWNQVGYPVVYASGSRSLAALEFLVHVPMALAPKDLSIAEINIKKNIKPKTIQLGELPPNWRDYPAPQELVELGTDWLKANSSLLLEVPSAVMEHEVNTLINPLHPDMQFVSISLIEGFSFDSRLFKK